MASTTVFMFSGQGSQYYGMGRELLAGNAAFAASMRSLDGVFADLGLPGVLAEIYRDDRTAADVFDRLAFTHPAIVMVELSLLAAVRAEGVEPDRVLGASLGELVAAAAAGALDVESLARAVVEQVGLVEEHCPPGGMLAVLGDVRRWEEEDAAARGGLELAAVNFDRHFVVSGGDEDLAPYAARLAADGVLQQRLAVAFAFHSARMDVAAEPYLRSLERLPLRPPAVPVVSCETARTVDRFASEHLWRMVRSPVRFRDAIRFLEEESDGGALYLDLGPAGSLASFARHNLRPGSSSQAVAVLDPFAPPGRGLERVRAAGRRRPSPRRSLSRGAAMKAILFPGQGSQSRGMGGELFREHPELTAQADEVLGYSIEQLCREDPDRRLDQTLYTQPALFVVNALSYRHQVAHGDNGAAFFAGHSLGEYNALHAAGAFDFATGLRLVARRAELMAQAGAGGMAAVIGLDEDAVRALLGDGACEEIDVANFNGGGQIILAGPRRALDAAAETFAAAGARWVPLRVSGAFHSRYMEPARRELEGLLAGVELAPLQAPVISNVTGRPHEDGEIRRRLAEQLVRPVRWEESVRWLLDQGEIDLEEVGPGRVLTGLVRRIRESPRPPAARTEPAAAPAGTNGTAPGAARPGVVPLRAPSLVPPRPAAPPPADAAPPARQRLAPERLGSAEFRRTYRTRYAYACGAMYRGIASEELVVRAGRAGVLAFFGTGGLEIERIERAIERIVGELPEGAPFGMNLVHNPTLPAVEEATVDLLLARGVRNLEASAFVKVTPALVRFRLGGLTRRPDGGVEIGRRIIAKLSRPEVAEAFLAPAPERLVRRLVESGAVSEEQARLAAEVPMADDLCVESDSGGHTDQGDPLVLLPTMVRLRDRVAAGGAVRVRVGAAGGIGTPEAAAAAFLLGAEFIVTGSINLCTVESGMSAVVKDMLEKIDVQDTDYAPAGDMFELGAKVQVLKRGVFFPARANKLYELYRRHESLDEIDPETRARIETRYFRKTFDEVWAETRAYFAAKDPREIEKAEQSPRHKMALVFRWYFGHSQRLAMEGREEGRVDFQVHCGPSLGAFNQWVRGTPLESWRQRHVEQIAERLMTATADYLGERLDGMAQAASAS